MKAISFSLWGTDSALYKGALANVELAKQYYPGWQCIFYTRRDVPYAWGAELVHAGALVIDAGSATDTWEGLFWRFQPIYDPRFTHTIVRDCDSRLNPREAAAVEEWLRSGILFHVMRDHIEHQAAIMGGMFGCKHWPLFETKLEAWKWRSEKGSDQTFLAEKIWPLVQYRCLGHDRYPNGVDWPSQQVYHYRPLEFFGAHTLKSFPAHEPLNPEIHGEFVGARVGLCPK